MNDEDNDGKDSDAAVETNENKDEIRVGIKDWLVIFSINQRKRCRSYSFLTENFQITCAGGQKASMHT